MMNPWESLIIAQYHLIFVGKQLAANIVPNPSYSASPREVEEEETLRHLQTVSSAYNTPRSIAGSIHSSAYNTPRSVAGSTHSSCHCLVESSNNETSELEHTYEMIQSMKMWIGIPEHICCSAPFEALVICTQSMYLSLLYCSISLAYISLCTGDY